jgi:hypothetical protein
MAKKFDGEKIAAIRTILSSLGAPYPFEVVAALRKVLTDENVEILDLVMNDVRLDGLVINPLPKPHLVSFPNFLIACIKEELIMTDEEIFHRSHPGTRKGIIPSVKSFFCWCMRLETKFTYEDIGHYFEPPIDHSTVIHHCKKALTAMENDFLWRISAERIAKRLYASGYVKTWAEMEKHFAEYDNRERPKFR